MPHWNIIGPTLSLCAHSSTDAPHLGVGTQLSSASTRLSTTPLTTGRCRSRRLSRGGHYVVCTDSVRRWPWKPPATKMIQPCSGELKFLNIGIFLLEHELDGLKNYFDHLATFQFFIRSSCASSSY